MGDNDETEQQQNKPTLQDMLDRRSEINDLPPMSEEDFLEELAQVKETIEKSGSSYFDKFSDEMDAKLIEAAQENEAPTKPKGNQR